jgi:hypothetical protein
MRGVDGDSTAATYDLKTDVEGMMRAGMMSRSALTGIRIETSSLRSL